MKFLEPVYERPFWKAIFQGVLPIVVGLFSGTFITEVTTSNGIEWMLFYKSISFYVLIGLTLLTFFYNRGLYLRETEVANFSDDDFCLAYMRSKCLPAAAAKYQRMIENGSGDELNKVMREFKKSLK